MIGSRPETFALIYNLFVVHLTSQIRKISELRVCILCPNLRAPKLPFYKTISKKDELSKLVISASIDQQIGYQV